MSWKAQPGSKWASVRKGKAIPHSRRRSRDSKKQEHICWFVQFKTGLAWTGTSKPTNQLLKPSTPKCSRRGKSRHRVAVSVRMDFKRLRLPGLTELTARDASAMAVAHPGWMASWRSAPGPGYVVSCINYRLSGEAGFPAQVQDVKAAIIMIATRAAIEGCLTSV